MFKGLGNLGNIASMMSSFKELPDKMHEINARMKEEHVSGTSVCGRVTVIVSCVGQVQSIKIEVEGLTNVEMELAILEASNEAGATAKQTYADSIRAMIAEMNLDIPGVDGLLTSFTGG